MRLDATEVATYRSGGREILARLAEAVQRSDPMVETSPYRGRNETERCVTDLRDAIDRWFTVDPARRQGPPRDG
ncbi:hypothetical protein IF650_11980 [Cellulosimicrobium terreum]|nr:hypothetical protein [Cellulosimicrobium terreum]